MVTMEDVRRAIDPDEPDYEGAVEELGSEALPFLAELSRNEDAMLASKAVSLAGLIGGDDAIPIVEGAAEAELPEVRIVAATAAGRLGNRGEDALVRLLDDEDVGVRKYALRAVPDTVPKRVRDVLERMSTSDADPSVRRRVEDLLGNQ